MPSPLLFLRVQATALAVLAAACIALQLASNDANAESAPIPLPADNRLMQFVYNPNDTYTILTRPASATHVELGPDETLEIVVMGDTFQWITSRTGKHFFIKPIKPDIFTSATLITNKRSYQLTFRASPENGKWMQRVSWHYPEIAMLAGVASEAKVRDEKTEKSRLDEVMPFSGLSPEKLNFGYVPEGEATFKPKTVFDDGKFMYIRFAPNTQELPAIFMVQADGALALVNYIVKGDLIVVQRLAKSLLFKLGKAEVRVNKADIADEKSGWWSFNKK